MFCNNFDPLYLIIHDCESATWLMECTSSWYIYIYFVLIILIKLYQTQDSNQDTIYDLS